MTIIQYNDTLDEINLKYSNTRTVISGHVHVRSWFQIEVDDPTSS